MKHGLKMLGGCILPFLIIFILPAFGVSTTVTIIIAFGLMLGCHLFMFMGHHGHSDQGLS